MKDINNCHGQYITCKILLSKIKSSTMKMNMDAADRVIKVIIAAVFAVLYFMEIIPGTLGLVLLILRAVFLY